MACVYVCVRVCVRVRVCHRHTGDQPRHKELAGRQDVDQHCAAQAVDRAGVGGQVGDGGGASAGARSYTPAANTRCAGVGVVDDLGLWVR